MPLLTFLVFHMFFVSVCTCSLACANLTHIISLGTLTSFPPLMQDVGAHSPSLFSTFQCARHMGPTVQSIWTFTYSWMIRSVFCCCCCYFFIEVRFANIQYNTQCSSHQVPSSVPVTQSPHAPCSFPLLLPLVHLPVRSLSCFVSLSIFPTHFPSFPLSLMSINR